MTVEQGLWHPVADTGQLLAAPMAVTLLDQRLVLWRGAEGSVQAWADRCPHRGAQLSLGQVEAGRLVCPYHGWEFAPGGHCERVPALPSFTPPPGCRVVSHEAQEAFGLIWVRLLPGSSELPAFAAESDPALRKLNCGPYDVATSAPRIVENFLDMAHFGFVHDGWLGDRAHAAIADYTVERTTTGLRAFACKAWQPMSNLHSMDGALVEYDYEVMAPFGAVLTKVPEPGKTSLANWRESIALFICPLTPESSRVWFRLAVADFDSPDERLQAFQHTIFSQDQPVLESQQPVRLPLDLRAEWHTAADKASSMYRRFLRDSGITFGVC